MRFPVEDAVECFKDPQGLTVLLVAAAMAKVSGDKVGFDVLMQWLTTAPPDLLGWRGVRL